MNQVVSEPVLKTSLVFEGTKAKLCLDVEKQFMQGFFRKLEGFACEAARLKKNLAVGPIQLCEDRPNIVGRYLKVKAEYTFLEPEQEAPDGWELYRTWDAILGTK